jgi:hypothetical protein
VDLAVSDYTLHLGNSSHHSSRKSQLPNHRSLLQAGCSKVFITSRKASACTAAVNALNALPNKPPGSRAYAIPADSSKVSEIERLVAEVSKHTDHIDILFANAGASWGSEFEAVDEKNGWDKVMDINVKGVFFTIQKYPIPTPYSSCGSLLTTSQIYTTPHQIRLHLRPLARHRHGLRSRHRNRFAGRSRRLLVRSLQSSGPTSRAQSGD